MGICLKETTNKFLFFYGYDINFIVADFCSGLLSSHEKKTSKKVPAHLDVLNLLLLVLKTRKNYIFRSMISNKGKIKLDKTFNSPQHN